MFGSAAYSAIGRALFSALFLLLTSLQPGLFAAANATGFHADGGITIAAEQPGSHDAGTQHAKHASAAAEHDEAAQKQHHDDSGSAKSKSCEIHCAPVLAVPVGCPLLAQPSVRCFAPDVASPLPLGEYAEFIQPPRSLN